MKKLVAVTHLMPWELDQFVELSAQLKRNSYYLNNMKVTLDVTLNLSDDIIDWKNSKLPMGYFQEKFDGIIKLYDWCEVNHKTISSGNYGCVTARVDTAYKYDDSLMMWIDPDVILSDLSLMFMKM